MWRGACDCYNLRFEGGKAAGRLSTRNLLKLSGIIRINYPTRTVKLSTHYYHYLMPPIVWALFCVADPCVYRVPPLTSVRFIDALQTHRIWFHGPRWAGGTHTCSTWCTSPTVTAWSKGDHDVTMGWDCSLVFPTVSKFEQVSAYMQGCGDAHARGSPN